MFINLLYLLFSILAAVGSLIILFTKSELFGLLILILVVICLSALYFLQGAPFVAITQLILHAGGILVLLICSLLFFKPITQSINKNKLFYKKEVVVVLMAICLTSYLVNKLKPFVQQFNLPGSRMPVGTVQELGYQILGPYGVVLELISILLLITLVGALYIVTQQHKRKSM